MATGGSGVSMVDEIGPFLDRLEKEYPELQSRVFNNGLWYVSSNAKKDMRQGKAGDARIEPLKYLKNRFDNKKSNRKWKRAGIAKAGRSVLRKERTADRKSHKRSGKGALSKFAHKTSYKKAKRGLNGSVGWLGASNIKTQNVGMWYQEGGVSVVTRDVRRHFAGLGIVLKKSTHVIRRPRRDIWNNVHAKHVLGGGMQRHMEEKLADKIAKQEKLAEANPRTALRIAGKGRVR